MGKFEVGDIFKLRKGCFDAIGIITKIYNSAYNEIHGSGFSEVLNKGDCIYHFRILRSSEIEPGIRVKKSSNELFFFESSPNGKSAERIGKSKLTKLLYKGEFK